MKTKSQLKLYVSQAGIITAAAHFSPDAALKCLAMWDCTAQLTAVYPLASSGVQRSSGSSCDCLRSHCLAFPPSRPPTSTTDAASRGPGYRTCLACSPLRAASPACMAALHNF